MYFKNYKFSFALWLILCFFLFSCQKKNEKAVILLSPSELYLQAEASEVVVIIVKCTSPFELKQLIIKSREDGAFSKTELDTLISGKDFHLEYEFIVPTISENTNITLEFELFDSSNERVINFRIIEVTGSNIYLTETAGHEMFSGNSGKQNGYNLTSGIPVYPDLTDSAEVDIADTTNSDTLLKKWISPSGIKFVKFNELDYANCTNVTAASAYNAGLKNDFIQNITIGDIYITRIRKRGSKEIYPVIKIVNIIDDPGSESDRYVFNIKR